MFPPRIAPKPYSESFAGYHFPLDPNSDDGFWHAGPIERSSMKTAEISDIPDNSAQLLPSEIEWLVKLVFWDETYKRPFRIEQADIDFAQRMRIPLPHTYYINRIQQNFAWLFYTGDLRQTVCAKSGQPIQTNWPKEYDGRILSESEYLKLVGGSSEIQDS